MQAYFDLEKLHEPVVVIEPDDKNEAILLAAFIRYDANIFHVSVERLEDGRIKTLTFVAENPT